MKTYLRPGTFLKNVSLSVDNNNKLIIKAHDFNVSYHIAEVSKEEGVKQIFYYKDTPVSEEFVVTNPKRLKYKKGDFGTEITVGIAYPQNMEIKDEIHNLLII